MIIRLVNSLISSFLAFTILFCCTSRAENSCCFTITQNLPLSSHTMHKCFPSKPQYKFKPDIARRGTSLSKATSPQSAARRGRFESHNGTGIYFQSFSFVIYVLTATNFIIANSDFKKQDIILLRFRFWSSCLCVSLRWSTNVFLQSMKTF